jgi:SAM-dependent methyltransferase
MKTLSLHSALFIVTLHHGCSSFTPIVPFSRTKQARFDASLSLSSNLGEKEITVAPRSTSQDDETNELKRRKQLLIKLLGGSPSTSSSIQTEELVGQEEQSNHDPVLACPITRRPLVVQLKEGPIIDGSTSGVGVWFSSVTPLNEQGENETVYSYVGRTDTYYNLLTPANTTDSDFGPSITEALTNALRANVGLVIPPPIQAALKIQKEDGTPYVAKRDLFTLPTVSFAYERGWRQGFTRAGFPGPDKEFEMVNTFFSTDLSNDRPSVVVDMSCATGLFTRRFASSGLYNRVIGCDYSDSMLQEARRRIRADAKLQSKLRDSALYNTKLELVRCDVAAMPMQSNSVDFVNAGAAMHCWPDVPKGLSEIYRVLRPGGKYFASTFLSKYFNEIAAGQGNQGAYNDFESKEKMEELLRDAGFSQISVEILGIGCVIIRCEK